MAAELSQRWPPEDVGGVSPQELRPLCWPLWGRDVLQRHLEDAAPQDSSANLVWCAQPPSPGHLPAATAQAEGAHAPTSQEG